MVSRSAALAVLLLTFAAPASAQERQGLEGGGIPAINFDSDEGFGYGAIVELYSYGERGLAPYEWTLQPRLFLTTEGRRDVTVFFDAPHALPNGWRLDVFLGTERQIATPYYGLGNSSTYDEVLDADEGPNPFFYRFGRTRNSARFNLQRSLGTTPLRFLVGGGVERTETEAVPEGRGTTLYETRVGSDSDGLYTNFVRSGLVWDSRDRETGPRRGVWTGVLVQWVDPSFGADTEFVRWTVTDRRYFSLTDRIVLANRLLLQSVEGRAPVFELSRVQTSFREQEGLGGAKSLRGILKNRFTGEGLFLWNSELRLDAGGFSFLGRSFRTVWSVFLDQGRVWAEGVSPGEILRDLHRGYGGGIRFGMGENFVVAFDAGTSSEVGAQIYIGLGYLY